MFPLKNRTLIRGCQAHINAGLGCGADYVASVGTDLLAAFDGVIETYFGNEGGNWSRLILSNGDKIEHAHLNSYVVKSGSVKAGQLIAKTGNTGTITTGPHLHIQIFRNGQRLDPEKYVWDTTAMTCEQELAAAKKFDAEERVPQIQRLQAEVKKLTDMINSPTEGIEALRKQIAERDVILDQKRAEIIELRKQLELCQSLTPEQQADLQTISELKLVLKKLI